ncbi:MAG: hypothetical protein OIF58_01330 [Cohaesibacter sp.]|nr:hypothetical protein [Cohaesibacter sp.]
MKFDIFGLFSRQDKSSIKSNQNLNINGHDNSVEQTINIYVGNTGTVENQKLRDIEELEVSSGSEANFAFNEESLSTEETEEIKTIVSYREIANEGDSLLAIKLLNKLKEQEKFRSGYLAFRLEYSIGIIQANMGEHEQAIASLRVAHGFEPNHTRAVAGLAFADLLEENFEKAYECAIGLLREDGDHTDICAATALNAARRLDKEIPAEDFALLQNTSSDVVYARTLYLTEQNPQDFKSIINEAKIVDPENKHLDSLWALHALGEARENEAFLLGAKMPHSFMADLKKCASILKSELETSLKANPVNKLLLPSQANNAAVAYRLIGSVTDASKIIESVIFSHPDLKDKLVHIRAVLFLLRNDENSALELLAPLANHAELQILASEIETRLGKPLEALDRLQKVFDLELDRATRLRALETKARVAIHCRNRNACEEAIEDIAAEFAEEPELVLVKSSFENAFEPPVVSENSFGTETSSKESNRELLASVANVETWSFVQIVQAAEELNARGLYRDCVNLLKDKVSYERESSALSVLCDACLEGGMGAQAVAVRDSFSEGLSNSPFGWRFGANVAHLINDIAKAVPLTRRIFEANPHSIASLQYFVNSLLRVNKKARVQNIVKSLDDSKMSGSLSEKLEYTKLLVFCGEVNRSRAFAYHLFCLNQNEHQSWMALNVSVLAFGAAPDKSDDLWLSNVCEDTAVEIELSNGDRRKYILETDAELTPLRHENINLDHPIALAVKGLEKGDKFAWPVGEVELQATIVSLKHKALEAFHFVLERFEEKYPDVSAFNSVRCDPTKEDGLDDLITKLRERSQYSLQKSKAYEEGSYPLQVLGYHLGLGPIDSFLGLKQECGVSIKTASCTSIEQKAATLSLDRAQKQGILADSVVIYLLFRLGLVEAVEEHFGKIAITQHTIDVFSSRLQQCETMGSYDENGVRTAKSMSYQNEKIRLHEISDDIITQKIETARSELRWLTDSCEIVPAVAKADPDEALLRFRNDEGGYFLDDLFACSGSGRVFLSEDFFLRFWGREFFGVNSCWVQSLLFYLEDKGKISSEMVVSATIELLELGETTLSTNSHRLLVGAKMYKDREITRDQLVMLCSLIGQPGANLDAHLKVALFTIHALWSSHSLFPVRQAVTSEILRSLVIRQRKSRYKLLDALRSEFIGYDLIEYLDNWQKGHFLA